jgi:hypothetical protein
VDPTENTAFKSPSIAVMGGCLAKDWRIQHSGDSSTCVVTPLPAGCHSTPELSTELLQLNVLLYNHFARIA